MLDLVQQKMADWELYAIPNPNRNRDPDDPDYDPCLYWNTNHFESKIFIYIHQDELLNIAIGVINKHPSSNGFTGLMRPVIDSDNPDFVINDGLGWEWCHLRNQRFYETNIPVPLEITVNDLLDKLRQGLLQWRDFLSQLIQVNLAPTSPNLLKAMQRKMNNWDRALVHDDNQDIEDDPSLYWATTHPRLHIFLYISVDTYTNVPESAVNIAVGIININSDLEVQEFNALVADLDDPDLFNGWTWKHADEPKQWYYDKSVPLNCFQIDNYLNSLRQTLLNWQQHLKDKIQIDLA